MVKSTKNSRIWFSLLKVLLLLGVLYLLLFQLERAQFDSRRINIDSYWALFIAILLVPINWFLEFKKWQLTVKISGAHIDPVTRLHSFLAGMVTGMLTPNMLGNFIGRLFYFQRRNRVTIILLTILSNYTQFAVSMFFGFIAILALNLTPLGEPGTGLLWLLGLIVILIVLGIFYFDQLFKLFFPARMRLYFRLKALNERVSFRWNIAALSTLRHLVFTIQFALTLISFGAHFSTFELLWIWQYYFWVTLTPSLFLGKFIVRDSVAMWVLSLAFIHSEIILISSLSIWFLNLLLPTFIALLIVRRKY